MKKDANGHVMPEVGDWLHASCSALDLGRIVAVGKDDNGVDTVDVEVGIEGLNELLHWQNDNGAWAMVADRATPDRFGENPVTSLAGPEGTKLTIRQLQWQGGSAHGITLGTPDGGCYRCTKFFGLERATFDERVRQQYTSVKVTMPDPATATSTREAGDHAFEAKLRTALEGRLGDSSASSLAAIAAKTVDENNRPDVDRLADAIVSALASAPYRAWCQTR